MQIDDVLDKYQDQLMSIAGVVGIGVGANAGQPMLVVMVAALTPEIKAAVPEHLGGFPVQVEVTGEISAF